MGVDVNTPLTDAEQAKYDLDEPQAYQAWEFARKMERERNRLLVELQVIRHQCDEALKPSSPSPQTDPR